MSSEITALGITFALIIIDYLTGIAKAIKNKDVSSEKMREGLWHKASYLIVLILAEIIEHGQHVVDMGFTMPILIPACVYIVVTELASILENLGEINPELQNSPILQLFRSNKEATHDAQNAK